MSSSYPRFGFNNTFQDGVSSNSEASGYPVVRLINHRLNSKYKTGATVPAYATADDSTSRTFDYVAIAGHDIFTQSATVTLQVSDDNFTNTTDVLSITPTSDDTIFKSFTPVTAKYVRLKIDTAGVSIAILSIGEMLQMPEYLWSDFDPLAESQTVKSATSFTGFQLGVDTRYNKRAFSLVFKYLKRTFLTSSDWTDFRDWAIRKRLPFFFSHNEGLYPSEAYFLNIPDKYKFSAKMKPSLYVDTVTIPVEGLIE